MKKIPTLFKRVFENGKIVDILPEFTDEKCKQAYYKGIPTLKLDGKYPYSIERRGNSPKESLEIMRAFLKNHYIEGLVFWLDGKPVCKIKRSDFGFEWEKEN